MQTITSEAKSVKLENNTYVYHKSPTSWTLTLRQSEVQVNNEHDLALLKVHNELFLKSQINWQEDAVTFTYQLPQDAYSFEQLKSLTQAEKLRAMLNMAAVEDLLELPFTYFIHPENLVFDYNLLPKIAYRGLAGKMPPKVTNNEVLLRQYKALIITLFEPDQDFTKLYEGQLTIKKGTGFTKKILELETFSDIYRYLNEQYQQTLAKNEKTLQTVSKVKFKVTKQLSIWMSALAVILIVPLVYFLFFQMPFKDRMLTTDTAFLKNDYEGVITNLDRVSTQKIPFTQKYELAYSFIQGKKLNDQQKKVILNNITLRADEKYLNYWIENGRGNLDEALDIAKNLRDSDLILYGLQEKIDQVRNDSTLSGTEKEEEITQLEADLKKYQEKRDESLEELENAEAEATATSGEAAQTTETNAEATAATEGAQ